MLTFHHRKDRINHSTFLYFDITSILIRTICIRNGCCSCFYSMNNTIFRYGYNIRITAYILLKLFIFIICIQSLYFT